MLETPPALLPKNELDLLFRRLVKQWHQETDILSDSTRSSMNASYQRIIGLGAQVVPLILQEMRNNGGHWFWALRAITGDDPVTPEMAGKITLMQNAWIKWGREKGYLGE